jgi:hypothetical protein
MGLPIAPLVGLGVGLIGGIGKMFGRGKANREMDKLLAKNPVYSENPLARQRLGLAQTLLNARMPGAAAVERNLFTNQATQLNRLDRGATDASQALAAAAGIGAGTDNSLMQLGVTEAQDYQRRLNNLTNAQEGVIQEGDKVFADQTRRYNDEFAVRGAQQQNRQNNWGDVSNFGFEFANFATKNPGMFKKNKSNNNISSLSRATAPQGMMRTGNFSVGNLPQPYAPNNFNIAQRPITPFARPPMNFNFNG